MSDPSQMRIALTPEEIRDRVAVACGAGLPTYVKLQAKAEIYLVNAAECEPLLQVDQQLVVRSADSLLRGLQYTLCATQAASQSAGEKGALVYSTVVPNPHPEFWQQLVG
ncbi:hypothetical protein [Yersinia intermedia]|uniref:hypothetical protein n=1 Tax=Yersinia intermedia TaxID=631 RepID=UPI0035C8A6A5